MRISQTHAAVIGAVEAWGETLGQLERLSTWPGLSAEQHAFGYVAIIMGAPEVTVGEIAARCGVPVEKVYQALRRANMPTPAPFDLVGKARDVPTPDLAVYPSNPLAYGEAK